MADEDRPASPDDIVKRYWDRIWIERDLDALAELYADPSIRHTASGTVTLSVAQLRHRIAEALRTVRGESYSIDALDVVEDRVWLRLTLYGISLTAATPVTLTWMAQYRIDDDRIAEMWALDASALDWHSTPNS